MRLIVRLLYTREICRGGEYYSTVIPDGERREAQREPIYRDDCQASIGDEVCGSVLAGQGNR